MFLRRRLKRKLLLPRKTSLAYWGLHFYERRATLPLAETVLSSEVLGLQNA